MNILTGWLVALLVATQLSIGTNPLLHTMEQHLTKLVDATSNQKVSILPDIATYQPMPERKAGVSDPVVGAKAALIYDVSSGQYLYQKNANQQVAMASLTKLMSALTIMQRHRPDEIVTVPANLPTLGEADEKIGLQAGQQFTVSDLLRALLVQSANDAANALAVWDAGSVEGFAERMNDYGKSWGLQDSHFVNANGLDTDGHYSSAQDLQHLSSILLNSQVFRQIVNTQKTTIVDRSGHSYALTSTNQDLAISYVYGIKTGFTDNAGQSLILLGRKDGHELITVVLNSPDRFQESKNMLDWAFNNYIWK